MSDLTMISNKRLFIPAYLGMYAQLQRHIQICYRLPFNLGKQA
jgi:hypothetical protein